MRDDLLEKGNLFVQDARRMKNLIQRIIERYLFAPFSNRVTKWLLWIGGSLVVIPTIDYLIFDLTIKYIFGMEIVLSYPTGSCLFAGCFVLFLAVIHNIVITGRIEKESQYELEIGSRKLRGFLPVETLREFLKPESRTVGDMLDYGKIRDHFQPVILKACYEIDRGNPEKGGELLRSVINQMPLGVIAIAFLNYGYYCSSVGNEKDSEYYRISLRIFEDSGCKDEATKEALSRIYRNLGEAARRERKNAEAEAFFKKAIEVSEDLENKASLADSISGLGLVYAQQCRHKEAELQFQNSISIYSKLKAESQIKRVRSYIDTLRSCSRYHR